MRNQLLYLDHIVESIQEIQQFTRDGRASFFESALIQAAVMRNLQTLIESAKRLDPEATGRHPEIAWERMAGLRNRLVHDYLAIDLETIWEIVSRDLGPLRGLLKLF